MTSVATAIQSYCEEQKKPGHSPRLEQSVGRVLFVGPHGKARRPLAAALADSGFEVLRSPTATEALDRVQREEVTLVITGGGGSKRTARSVLRGLRESTHHAHLPVIWLGTASDDEEALLRQGVSLFVRAPFPVEHLVSAAMFAV